MHLIKDNKNLNKPFRCLIYCSDLIVLEHFVKLASFYLNTYS